MILLQKIKSCSVLRVEKKAKLSPDYLPRFLTAGEIRYCQSKRYFAESAAARLAAKQACLSLFKVPQAQTSKWLIHVEVKRTADGRPVLKLSQAFRKNFKILKNQSLLLSLAHERKLAIAWVALVTDAVPRGSVRNLTPARACPPRRRTASGA